jgi:hypothetical protein
VKGEHAARGRRRIGVVAKQDLGRRGDIFEADLPLFLHQVAGYAVHVTLGLLGEAGERGPLGLGFDDSAEPAIDEKRIVDRTGVGLKLAHRDALRCATFICARLWIRKPPSANLRSIAARAMSSGWKALSVTALDG